MEKKTIKNIKLGIFVSLGILIFIAVIYIVGANQNLFGSTTKLSTVFKNVSGLQVGNNVRFSGINVGTVEQIELISDSTVKVNFVVKNDAAQFIKKDSEATVASEGLMGNKVLNLSSGSSEAERIEDETVLPSAEPVEIEAIIADLKVTAGQAKAISQNIEEISSLVKEGKGTIGRLLTDPELVNTFDRLLYTLKASGDNALEITNGFARITNDVQAGKGMLGKMLVDEEMAGQMTALLDSLELASNNVATLSRQLNEFGRKLNNSEGPVGRLLTDTTMAGNLEKTLLNLKAGSDDLEGTLQKINNSWILNLFSKNEEKAAAKRQKTEKRQEKEK